MSSQHVCERRNHLRVLRIYTKRRRRRRRDKSLVDIKKIFFPFQFASWQMYSPIVFWWLCKCFFFLFIFTFCHPSPFFLAFLILFGGLCLLLYLNLLSGGRAMTTLTCDRIRSIHKTLFMFIKTPIEGRFESAARLNKFADIKAFSVPFIRFIR